jgi:hypothetical protein
MFSEVESVGAQKARERRNKAWHMLQGAMWTLGAVALFIVAVGAGIAFKWPSEPVNPLFTVRLPPLAMPTCSHINMKHCVDNRVTVCQTTIDGKTVYSSDAC